MGQLMPRGSKPVCTDQTVKGTRKSEEWKALYDPDKRIPENQPSLQLVQPADHAIRPKTTPAGLQDAAARLQSDWLSLPVDVKRLITAYRLLSLNHMNRRLTGVCVDALAAPQRYSIQQVVTG